MWSVFPIAFLGCASTTLNGVIEDAQSKPIANATVSSDHAEGCETTTDATGQFLLECASGSWRITIGSDGYLSNVQSISVTEGTSTTLPTVQLTAIPSSDGLFMLSGGVFEPLHPVHLERTITTHGKAKNRAFCIPKQDQSPAVASEATVTILSKNTGGWRPFRMDANGCAYRDAKTVDGHWVVEHQDQPALQTQAIDETVTIHRMTAPTGDYFLADWAGFFVPIDASSAFYKGHWLQISG
jgi:hypothetical protein